MPEKKSPVVVASEILKQKYPDARVAFVAGSFNRGEATPYSDIDLVVIFEKLKAGWRESCVLDGGAGEVFFDYTEKI
jgi:predicted nucleotidyltransferase